MSSAALILVHWEFYILSCVPCGEVFQTAGYGPWEKLGGEINAVCPGRCDLKMN